MTVETSPKQSRLWQAALGVLLSAALLLLVLRQVDLGEVLRHLRTAHPLPLLVAIILATSTFVFRVFRWRLLLQRENGESLPYRPLWHSIAMGFMANNVLPFRAGELIRTYAIARLARVRFTTAFSSIAVERVFDALAVVALLTVALFQPGMPPDVSVGGVAVAQLTTKVGVVCAIALVVGAAVVAWPRVAERVVRRIVPIPRLAERLVALLEGLLRGLQVLQSPKRLAAVLGWSVFQWGVNALSFYAAFSAFDIRVNFAGALLLQGLIIFGISVPSTPGFVGVFEFVIVAGLALYDIPADQAFSYAIAYHTTTFLPITLLGLWSVARTHLGLRELRREART